MTKHIFDIENALMAEKNKFLILKMDCGIEHRFVITLSTNFENVRSLVFEVSNIFYGMWDWLETAQSNKINCWSLLSNLSDEEEFWDESSAN